MAENIENKKYDSTYSILLDILDEVKQGGGGSCNLQEVSTTITTNGPTTITADPEFDGISTANVTVAVPEPYLIPLEVTQNGTYVPEMDVDGYSDVTVNVPEQKPEEIGNETIIKNGKVKFTPTAGSVYSEMNVDVQVPIPTFETEELTATENKVYTPTKDGYSKVTVDVPIPALEERTTKEITRNGNYTIGPTINPETSKPYDGMKLCDVTVNVPIPEIKLQEKSVTSNGPVTPDSGFDGLSKVDVNVPTGGASFDWEGTGYTPANSNQIDQADFTRKQEAINYAKQKYAEWDPSRTIADSLYSNDKKLVYAPNIDLKNVTATSFMFSGCKSLTTLPDGFSCPETTNTNNMFSGCSSLTTLPDGFSLPKATNTSSMFSYCSSLTTLPDGFSCPLTTDISYMFQSCSSLTVLPDGFNCPEATDTSSMFSGCSSLKSLPKLDFGKVTNIDYFFGFSTINTLTDLGGFTGLKIDWNDNYGLKLCPNLTKQSVLNVINELYDFRANGDASTTKTIKFHANSLALLSDEEKLIATNKGWNLVS